MGIPGSNWWRYVSTIFQAIWIVVIFPENLGLKNGLTYGRYLQFRFLKWPLILAWTKKTPSRAAESIFCRTKTQNPSGTTAIDGFLLAAQKEATNRVVFAVWLHVVNPTRNNVQYFHKMCGMFKFPSPNGRGKCPSHVWFYPFILRGTRGGDSSPWL